MWVAGAAILLALGFLVVRGLGDATVYFRTADEAVAQRDALGDRRFRIEGDVVPGTVREFSGTVDFRIASNGVEVPVVHHGDPPELFKPGTPVVLEGRFEGEQFASDRIMVKHTETYIAENPDRVTTLPPGPSGREREADQP
ncbi:MAG TPA: cytochrome c maturation protein CcmE [Acidimicrobiales bacterium]|nr:cytochrome c maturation protein CcmE [Acidimicrobiales bacterium]